MNSWIFAFAFFLIGSFVFAVLIVRIIFGTYSIPEAYHIFKTIRELEKKYSSLFDQRDNLLYHIGWAKVSLLLFVLFLLLFIIHFVILLLIIIRVEVNLMKHVK